jgi:hypothetical protein
MHILSVPGRVTGYAKGHTEKAEKQEKQEKQKPCKPACERDAHWPATLQGSDRREKPA